MFLHLNNHEQTKELAETLTFLANNRPSNHRIDISDPTLGEPMPSFEGVLFVHTHWVTKSGGHAIGDRKLIMPNGDFLYLD